MAFVAAPTSKEGEKGNEAAVQTIVNLVATVALHLFYCQYLSIVILFISSSIGTLLLALTMQFRALCALQRLGTSPKFGKKAPWVFVYLCWRPMWTAAGPHSVDPILRATFKGNI